MTSRPTSSSSSTTPSLLPRSSRPSIARRLSTAVSQHSAPSPSPPSSPSNPTNGPRTSNGTTPEAPLPEDLTTIRRYADISTIDWVQDATREQLRRRAQQRKAFRHAGQPGFSRWRRRAAELYDSGQAWIVVTLVGAAIGLNGAFLNIVTEWLSDAKLGYCATAFYLNKDFCCFGAEDGCEEWVPWTRLGIFNYLVYIIFATIFAFFAAFLVQSYAPYAAGSGVSEIKCIIAGFVMKGFLGFQTLLIKSIGLPLAIASGLSVGKEGPSIHYAVCTGNVISRMFGKYKENAGKTREILSASAAAGVAVAFGSPIGGVLFSLEEMSSHFPLKTMWRSYFCALVATVVMAAMNPFRTGQLVMFQVKYDRDWHFFELPFYIVLGIFGGIYGAFVIKWHLRAQAFRKNYLAPYALTEAIILAAGTAIICYTNAYLRIDMTEEMEILFRECEGSYDYNGLCEKSDRWLTVSSLAIATVIRTVLVCISYGCRVPAGIFVPSMAIGASFGRMLGILVQALHEARPDSRFFASCKPDVPCVTPGTYAFLGAAAALSGIMHITVSVVVIMFELTGALTFILPTMIVVGVTKAISGRLGRGGIADRMIRFNGYPFLDNKEEHVFGVTVSKVMREEPAVIPCSGMELQAVQELLEDHEFQGYPVVDDRSTMMLLGYIDQTTLRYAIERATKERFVPLTATCFFTPPPSGQPTPTSAAPPITFDTLAPDSAPRMTVDFSRHVDPVPLAVHPHLALETVMEIFKKMGPRAILIEHRGQLAGLVTVKDCLRFQNKVEAETAGHQKDEHFSEEVQQRLWDGIVLVAEWVSERLSRCTRGRVRLSSPMLERARARSSSRSPERSRARGRRRGRRGEDPAAEGRGMLAAVEAGPGDSLELERR